MLVVITTDAVLAAAELDAALRAATRVSFDRLDSDGCMSTNDQVTLLASGASGVGPDLDEFTAALTEVCPDLALQLQARCRGREPRHRHRGRRRRDRGRRRRGRPLGRPQQPVQGGRSSATTPTGAGCSPRSARPTAAVRPVRRRRVDERRAGLPRRRARPAARATSTSRRGAVHVLIDLHAGEAAATILTNDLTHDYVHENSAYSS